MLKTTWFSIVLSVVLAVLGALQATDWVNIFGSDAGGLVVTGLGLANMIAHYFVGSQTAPASKP